MSSLSYWLSSEFWTPDGHDWSKVPEDGGLYPRVSDLYEAAAYAVVLTLIRFVLDYFVFKPVAYAYLPESVTKHLNSRAGNGTGGKAGQRGDDSPQLEIEFRAANNPSAAQLQELSNRIGMSCDEVGDWFHHRRRQQRARKAVKKMSESFWRFVFYTFIFLYGLYVCMQEPWFYDLSVMFDDFPWQKLDQPLRLYYLISLGFYFHLFVAQFFEGKKKDFWEMFAHHVATIALLTTSYLGCLIRPGSMMILVHDVSDPFLESAKLFNYTKFQLASDICFGLFALVFFVARLVIFPFKVIPIAVFFTGSSVGWFGGLYFMACMVTLLQILHIFWFSIIFKMLRQFIRGEMKGDARSQSDTESDSSGVSDQDDDASSTKKGGKAKGKQ